MKSSFLASVVITTLLISGCSSTHQPTSEIESDSSLTASQLLEDSVLEDKLLAVVNQGSLILVNPHKKTFAPVYQFQSDLPNTTSSDSFHVSPNHDYVIWYVPGTGIRALNLDSGVATTIATPTTWFNQNPFIFMDATRSVFWYIDDRGSSRIEIDLTTGNTQKLTIPYPYGTKFIASKDTSKVIYIAGFGQNLDKPEYLFTDQSANATLFTTNGELADRDNIAFVKSDSAMVGIEEGSKLIAYPFEDLKSPYLFADLISEGRIIDLMSIDNLLTVKVLGGNIVYLDANTGKIVKKVPAEIASGLNQTRLIPWTSDIILINETLSQFEDQFQRLWVSDLMGSKRILIPEFGRTLIISPTITDQKLDN